MRSRFIFSFIAVLFLMSAPLSARAADNDPSKFSRSATPVDSVTLQAEGLRITLWGIKPVGQMPITLKALDMMDNMIAAAPVTCRAISGTPTDVVARCSVRTGEDLGLELLSHGLAVVDRQQATASVPAYMEAQRAARKSVEGVWSQVVTDDKAAGIPVAVQLLLGTLPIAGLLIIAFVMHFRLKSLETQQQEEHEQARRKENQLVTRERYVLVSTLEGELSENKNRIEAFLTIYGGMLENLTNKAEKPKYQQAGDIVQKHPSLSKTVFESSVSKLSLLDMKLAAQLSKLYAALPKEQEYINIESNVPLETAVALVKKVLQEAEELMPPIAAAIAALEEIVAKSRKVEA